MTVEELGVILNDMYSNSPDGQAVAMIHLFGIKYAVIIKNHGYTSTEIIRAANINKSYAAELSKGIKLASFVDVKTEYM